MITVNIWKNKTCSKPPTYIYMATQWWFGKLNSTWFLNVLKMHWYDDLMVISWRQTIWDLDGNRVSIWLIIVCWIIDDKNIGWRIWCTRGKLSKWNINRRYILCSYSRVLDVACLARNGLCRIGCKCAQDTHRTCKISPPLRQTSP